MFSQKRSPIICTPYNIDGEHSQMEMLLASIFDSSYTHRDKTIIASNGSLEYHYTKGPVGNSMSIHVLSLDKPRLPFVVRFAKEKFPVRTVVHPLLDISNLQ
jgi:hypothetical protein